MGRNLGSQWGKGSGFIKRSLAPRERIVIAGWLLLAAFVINDISIALGYPGIDIDTSPCWSAAVMIFICLIPFVPFFMGFGLSTTRRVWVHSILALPIVAISTLFLVETVRSSQEVLPFISDEASAGKSRLRAYWTHRAGSDG